MLTHEFGDKFLFPGGLSLALQVGCVDHSEDLPFFHNWCLGFPWFPRGAVEAADREKEVG